MIVAFLDLLAFSAILESNNETAKDIIYTFNNMIKTKVVDAKVHTLAEYEKQYPNETDFHNFVEKSSVTSFEQMISFSDSLVLGGSNPNLFITQLSNFVSSVFVQYSQPFQQSFVDIENVKSDYFITVTENYEYHKHMAFPIMFRGGISVGDDVVFFNEHHIKDSELKHTSLNVMGLVYLNAVKLESSGKGPRLFCDKSVVDAISNKKTVKIVDKEKGIYEIIWTIEGCEATGRSSNHWCNVIDAISKKLLPASINLYMYYKDKEETIAIHYKNLLDLVCTGIVKYAKDMCDKEQKAIDDINTKLIQSTLPIITNDILDGFLE